MKKLKLGLGMLLAAAAICALPVLAFADDTSVSVAGKKASADHYWVYNGTTWTDGAGTTVPEGSANYVVYDKAKATITLKGTLDVSEGEIEIRAYEAITTILVDDVVTIEASSPDGEVQTGGTGVNALFELKAKAEGCNFLIKSKDENGTGTLTLVNKSMNNLDGPSCIYSDPDDELSAKISIESLKEFSATTSITTYDTITGIAGGSDTDLSFSDVSKIRIQTQVTADGKPLGKTEYPTGISARSLSLSNCPDVSVIAGPSATNFESVGIEIRSNAALTEANSLAIDAASSLFVKGEDAAVKAASGDSKVTTYSDVLKLADGAVLTGSATASETDPTGEVVFDTATGYYKIKDTTDVAKVMQVKAAKTALERFAGVDRYDTGAQAADAAALALGSKWNQVVVLVTGENYPDALCANAVAGVLGGVIVPTTSTALNAYAKAEIEKLEPTKIVVVGGTAAVSEDVEKAAVAAAAEGCESVRYAGEDRYGTCADILEKVFNESAGFIVASGVTGADALSAASYSYNQTTPIVLVDETKTIPKVVTDALAKNEEGAENAILLGGNEVLSADAVYAQLGLEESDCVLLAGDDRYETARIFADFAMTGKVGGVQTKWLPTLTAKNAGFAAGADDRFCDALCAGPLCGANGSIMLLVDDPENTDFRTYVSGIKSQIRTGYVFGGTAAIPEFEL